MYLVYVNPRITQMYRDRHPEVRVNVTVPLKADEFNVHQHSMADYAGPFAVEDEASAQMLANHMALKYPTQEVVVSKIITKYQTTTPSVRRKDVTEAGTLPA